MAIPGEWDLSHKGLKGQVMREEGRKKSGWERQGREMATGNCYLPTCLPLVSMLWVLLQNKLWWLPQTRLLLNKSISLPTLVSAFEKLLWRALFAAPILEGKAIMGPSKSFGGHGSLDELIESSFILCPSGVRCLIKCSCLPSCLIGQHDQESTRHTALIKMQSVS